ncbi:hypothetical protein CPB84DRAFT_1680960 [Gymnopilus junonius]|uniref:Uncharacterized protein n=1 Tax=Gymnopilus junonius TaxID=109634 RepID=A0A9P5NN09_GYMJU|nr:hypothetical protein CPB84DRAFT_1680960 [Gymnopilus junonius]
MLSVKAFAKVPAVLDLPEILRDPASASNVSSRHESIRNGVDLSEGCMLTKSVKYSHQLAHFVNAVNRGDPGPIVEVLKLDLKIIPYEPFTLEDPCNCAYLESFVHTSLDLYAFIALAPSFSTVEQLINMVKSDNDRRVRERNPVMNIFPSRHLNFEDPSFKNPEYELVALHPEHFLPCGAILPIFDPMTGTHKYYVPSRDRRLRESINPNSTPLPPFRHVFRHELLNVNIFLVAINAEIKFRRYFKMIAYHPPPTPLPNDVLTLMHRVIELVRLLYWTPDLQGHPEGTRGNSVRTGRPTRTQHIEVSSGEESESSNESGTTVEENVPRTPTHVRRRSSKWLPNADAETRRAYGTSLMGIQDMGIDYDPALFEDAYPIDDTVQLYSDSASIENWTQSVTSEV